MSDETKEDKPSEKSKPRKTKPKKGKTRLMHWQRRAVAKKAAALRTKHSWRGAMSWRPMTPKQIKEQGQMDLATHGLTPDETTQLKQDYRNERAAEEHRGGRPK